MHIAGIQKTTLVDYPGKVAATIFTRGCTFLCPFCHNPELVIPSKFNPLMDKKEIILFLKSRIGKLQAVCITGGEPTIQKDIIETIQELKKMGYLVKLDSNGSRPKVLEKIIKNSGIDYIAMDIKSSLDKYLLAIGYSSSQSLDNQQKGQKKISDRLKENIKQSIDLIMKSNIEYEFRTTVCHPIHEIEDFKEIGRLIKGAKNYFIQNFVQSKHIDECQKFKPFTNNELNEAKRLVSKHVGKITIR